jgi:hypothetical protein
MRALSIFLDTADLGANPGLWSSIEDALRSSQWFILLASADAAASIWVNREVQWWIANRSPDRLLVVGTSPGLAWDEQEQDWAAGAPIPAALRGAFTDEPRWVDLSGMQLDSARPVVPPRDVAAVAAPIRGKHLDELVGEHLQQHRRAMHLAEGAVAMMALLTALAVMVSVLAIRERNSAIRELDLAISGQLASQSEALGGANPALAKFESLAAWRIDPSPQTRFAMLNAATLPGIATLAGDGTPVESLAFSSDSKTLASGSFGGTAMLQDIGAGGPVGRPYTAYFGPPLVSVVFSADGKVVASSSTNGTPELWNVATRKPIGQFAGVGPGLLGLVAISRNGEIVATGDGDVVGLWDVASSKEIGQVGSGSPSVTLAFSPDGKILASGNADGTVTLWDVATQDLIGQPLSLDPPAN